jgi:hypothetical protein
MHHPDVGEFAQRLQARAPDPVLERGLGHRADSRRQGHLQHLKERRQGPQGQLVARRCDEVFGRVDHAFLDFVPADRRAADPARQSMSEGGLAGARRSADDYQTGSVPHGVVIAEDASTTGMD